MWTDAPSNEAPKSDQAVAPTRPIFTIGHSNHSMDEFLDLVKMHALDVVVDVRSQPYSRFAPHFSRKSLEQNIIAAGFKYLFLGEELGGRPHGQGFYDSDGRVVYTEVEKAVFFKDGIARLETGIQRFNVALLCSEEDPTGCHRRLLVGRVLTERGTSLLHIRGDGRIEREDRVLPPGDQQATGQLALFPDVDEGREWKSIRSVLPRDQPRSSSEH